MILHVHKLKCIYLTYCMSICKFKIVILIHFMDITVTIETSFKSCDKRLTTLEIRHLHDMGSNTYDSDFHLILMVT